MSTAAAPVLSKLARPVSYDVATVLQIVDVHERWISQEEAIDDYTIVVTALIWSQAAPDTVTLVRGDLVDEDEEEDGVIRDREPSFWWHQFPAGTLTEALAREPRYGHTFPVSWEGEGEGFCPAVHVCLGEEAADWITIRENVDRAGGDTSARLPECYESVHVPADQIRSFLSDVASIRATAA